MLCFWDFITKCVKRKDENGEETQFWEKKVLRKFVFHETKKNELFPVCYNYEPSHSRGRKRSEYYSCWILIHTRNITFNYERVQETQFHQNLESEWKIDFASKNEVSGQVKVDSLPC